MAARNKGKGRRRSESEWHSLLARFGGSGLGVEAFCRREAISESSFYRWRSALGDGREDGNDFPDAPVPAFVDLGALASAPPRPHLDLKLDLGDGLILHLVRN